MDGFELLRRLKERGDLTPAIMLNGYGSREKALPAVLDLRAFWLLENLWTRAPSGLLWIARLVIRDLQKTDELKRDLSLRGMLGDLVGPPPRSSKSLRSSRRWRPHQRPY